MLLLVLGPDAELPSALARAFPDRVVARFPPGPDGYAFARRHAPSVVVADLARHPAGTPLPDWLTTPALAGLPLILYGRVDLAPVPMATAVPLGAGPDGLATAIRELLARRAETPPRPPGPARDSTNGALRRIAGQAARLGGWTIELPSRRLTWSDEVALMHDLPPGTTPSLEEGLAMFAPEHREEILSHLERCARDGTPYDVEIEKITATGRRIWVRTIGEAIRDPEGRIIRLQGALQDITERKVAELRIQNQAALLDKAQDAIVVRGLDGRIRYWNKSAERLYGWPALEAVGRPMAELLAFDPDDYRTAEEELLRTGEWTGELDHRTRAGEGVTVEARWTLVRDDQGRPHEILAISTDITRRRQLEQQFLRAQRLESIGTLAGGIAHDLNNVLAPILLSADLLGQRLDDPDLRQSVETIGASARRGAELVRQVLAFARGLNGRQTPLAPVELVRDMVAIAVDTFPKNIRIETRVADPLPAVVGDPTQLQQVLINLSVNARDAMPDGGHLTLIADEVEFATPEAAGDLDAQAGRYVRLVVADTGTGIPPEIFDKIFDPFFTTKEFGKGTGLGLATSRSIIKSHGGFLRVETTPGQGTRFIVHLPVATPGAAPVPAAGRDRIRPGGGECILVVDDEEPVRRSAGRVLEAAGYRVLLAAGGREGIARFAAHAGEVALLLTDLMMPDLDGSALITALRARRPELPVLAVSGLDAPEPSAPGVPSGMAFLQKPFTAEELLTAVARALHPHGGPREARGEVNLPS